MEIINSRTGRSALVALATGVATSSSYLLYNMIAGSTSISKMD